MGENKEENEAISQRPYLEYVGRAIRKMPRAPHWSSDCEGQEETRLRSTSDSASRHSCDNCGSSDRNHNPYKGLPVVPVAVRLRCYSAGFLSHTETARSNKSLVLEQQSFGILLLSSRSRSHARLNRMYTDRILAYVRRHCT